MRDLFLSVLNMSLSGAVVILAVILARQVLRRASKKWSYLLWAAAGFRLCFPAGIKSRLSIFNLLPQSGSAPKAQTSIVYIFTPAYEAGGASAPAAAAAAATAAPMAPAAPAAAVTNAASNAAGVSRIDTAALLLTIAAAVWLAGAAAVLIISAVRYIKLRRGLASAVRTECGAFISDIIDTPFTIGFVKPRIFIPRGMEGDELACVLAHERCHIRRGDNIIKPLAFAVLAVHWFNPLCWLAFHLMSKDMEMSCDEKVLSCGGDLRRAYGMALVSMASGVSGGAYVKAAFGQNAVKSRVKNVMRWKKPRRSASVAAALLVIMIFAACVTDPKEASAASEMRSPAAEAMLPAASSRTVFKPSQGVIAFEPGSDEAPRDNFDPAAYVRDYNFLVRYYTEGRAGVGAIGNYDDYMSAAKQALNYGINPRDYFGVMNAAVLLEGSDRSFFAYNSDRRSSVNIRNFNAYELTVSRYKFGRPLGEMLYRYPAELYEAAADRITALAGQYLNMEYDAAADPLYGFVGENYVVCFVQTTDQRQVYCLYYSEDGSVWYELGGNRGCTLRMTGACVRSRYEAYLCYECAAGDPAVYRTNDGGISWSAVSLELPAEYSNVVRTAAGSPVFDGEHGVIIVTCIDAENNKTNVWFETNDSGATWHFGPGQR